MNRQRYMAELSKLLSFMFKEDRAEILQHYNELLDNAEDEEALLEEFGSPTKLAVTISRTYDREERKLSVNADSKLEEEVAQQTEFSRPAESEFKTIRVVPPEKEETAKAEPEPEPEDENFTGSYADIIEEIRRELAAERGHEYVPIFFDEPKEKAEEPVEEEEPAVEEEVSEEEEAPEEEEEVIPEVLEEELPEETEEAPEEEPEEESEEEVEPEDPQEEESEAEPEEAQDAPEEEEASDEEEAVEEASEEESPVEELEEAVEEEEETVPEKHEEETVFEEAVPKTVVDILNESDKISKPETESEEEYFEDEAETRLSPGLLILYLIFAIPLGLIALVLLAAVTLTVLGFAAAVMGAGVLLVTFSLSGIAVVADMILVIGAAIIAFAVGILLLWTAFWLILSAFKALIGGIIKLGRRVCVKEAE